MDPDAVYEGGTERRAVDGSLNQVLRSTRSARSDLTDNDEVVDAAEELIGNREEHDE